MGLESPGAVLGCYRGKDTDSRGSVGGLCAARDQQRTEGGWCGLSELGSVLTVSPRTWVAPPASIHPTRFPWLTLPLASLCFQWLSTCLPSIPAILDAPQLDSCAVSAVAAPGEECAPRIFQLSVRPSPASFSSWHVPAQFRLLQLRRMVLTSSSRGCALRLPGPWSFGSSPPESLPLLADVVSCSPLSCADLLELQPRDENGMARLQPSGINQPPKRTHLMHFPALRDMGTLELVTPTPLLPLDGLPPSCFLNLQTPQVARQKALRETERVEFAEAKERLKSSWAADREDFARVKEGLKRKNAEHHIHSGRLSQVDPPRCQLPCAVSVCGILVLLPWPPPLRSCPDWVLLPPSVALVQAVKEAEAVSRGLRVLCAREGIAVPAALDRPGGCSCTARERYDSSRQRDDADLQVTGVRATTGKQQGKIVEEDLEAEGRLRSDPGMGRGNKRWQTGPMKASRWYSWAGCRPGTAICFAGKDALVGGLWCTLGRPLQGLGRRTERFGLGRLAGVDCVRGGGARLGGMERPRAGW